MLRARCSPGSLPPRDRLPGPTHHPRDKMPPWAPWRALSVVLILVWAHLPAAGTCPQSCACYIPTEVHCTFRSLASVPSGISKHVERINLGFNSIQAVSETSFAGLTKLELLMVHGNNIPSIPDGALRDLSSLQVFKFSYNKLRVITAETLQGLRSLVRLHVDHNQLEFIHPQAFLGLTALRLLHLEGNQLRHLHPGTFSTFAFLGYFRLSNVRHLYLAENRLRGLPEGLLQNMPLLENLYLQGNPWACDCEMTWFLRWEAKAAGVLKCKKDKAYEGGQSCAACASPRTLRGQEIHRLADVPCRKPAIESPLRRNDTRSEAEEAEDEDPDGEGEGEGEGDGWVPPDGFPAPPWHVALNMTDEHGNTVSLACGIRKPRGVYGVRVNQTESQELDVNATVALTFACPMTRDNYEKLWKLIAYYSEVPVRLRRDDPPAQGPGAAARYRQDADDHDALYYTGVRAHVRAEPAWVLQPSVELQLNRRQSSAKQVLLSYSSRVALTASGGDAGQARGRSWVMIEPGAAGRRAQTVLEGATCQLSCNVKASESPSIFWVLPDGTVLKAPVTDADGRFSILTSGWLKIKAAEPSDSGVYQCVARVRDETDRVAYRVLVQPADAPPSGGRPVTVRKNPGDAVALPCHATGVPEAQLSWILPSRRIVSDFANASQAHMLPDGTLSIPNVRPSDSGYYTCVAVNRRGADRFTVAVAVNHKGPGRSSKRGRRPGSGDGKALSRLQGDVVDEGGSGLDGDDFAARRVPHPKDPKAPVQGAETRKGRRKLKPWKSSEKEPPETNVAEGRRAFESRRRVSMANKQITPEHWADILARVRGKNLAKGTEAPEAAMTAAPPSDGLQVTPVSPVASPPEVSPARTAGGADESSADALFFGYEEPLSSSAPSPGVRRGHGQGGGLGAEAKATSSTDLGGFTGHDHDHNHEQDHGHDHDHNHEQDHDRDHDRDHDHDHNHEQDHGHDHDHNHEQGHDHDHDDSDTSPEETDERPLVPDIHATGTVAPTWTHEVPHAPSTPPILDAIDEEPVAEPVATEAPSLVGAGPTPEPPSGAVSSGEPDAVRSVEREPGMNSQPDGETMKAAASGHLAGTPALSAVDARTPEPLADITLGAPDVPGQGQMDEQAGGLQLLQNTLSTGGHPVTKAGAERRPPKLPGGDRPQTGPPDPRRPESERRGVESNTAPGPGLGMDGRVTPFPSPGGTARGHLLDQDGATTPALKASSPSSAPALHPSRKRPSGRRRPRPHKPRQRHRQTPPTVPAPADTPSTRPHRPPEDKIREAPGGLLVPTVAVPGQAATGKHAEPVTGGSPRRKHGKRPGRHRYGTSTPSVSRPRRPGDEREDLTTSSPEAVLVSTAASPGTGDPRERTGGAERGTVTPKTHLSRHTSQEMTPAAYTPASGTYTVADTSDRQTDRVVPGESLTDVPSPSGSQGSTGGEFKKQPPSPRFPGTSGRDPPPARPRTDAPVTGPSETLPGPSALWKEPGDPGVPSEASPSAAVVPTRFPREDGVASTAPPGANGESASAVTARGDPGTAPATVLSEMRPHGPPPAPAPTEEPVSQSPSTAPVSLVTAAARPTHRPPGTSPVPTAPDEKAFLNHVGIPDAPTLPASNEGTPLVWSSNELSTSSPKSDGFPVTPKQELGKEAFDDGTQNSLPRGPGGPPQDGRVHISHPPARVPWQPRGTARPPQRTTQSPLGYPVTLQPARHLTNKPGITAYPSRVLPDKKHLATPTLSSPTTPVGPWRPSRPGKVTDRGTGWFHAESKAFGNNDIPDLRDVAGWLPGSRVARPSDGRLPFVSNGTVSFARFGVTPKPQAPTSPAPGVRDRNVNAGAYNRIYSQGITHVDFGPPAPPSSNRPRTTSPPSPDTQHVPTRGAIPFVTSAGPPSRSHHPSSAKLFSAAGGPPASKFWTLGERPQIITKSPQTVTVAADTDAVLPCEATGKPTPFVTWTKVSTGALMTPNTRVQRFEVLKNGTFVIRKVQVQDRGQYMCTAKNLHGVDRMVVLLSVSVQQPQIAASHYQDVTVYLGDTIAMECLAKGTPAPQISWIFPDRRVWQTVSPVEGRVTLHENRTLSIKEASFADRGVYKCVASNAAGADSLAIRLHVAALPPVIHQEKLENISLPPGLSIHIHCTAKAAPLPSVRWVLWDGTQIRPSQFINGNLFVFPNGTLYIRNLAPKDSGRYECVAANLVGTARRTVQLDVRRAAANARITGTSPQRTNVRYGGTLRLDCSASGDPWPRILWRLPSKQMIDTLFSFDARVKVFANGTLVVRSVTEKDSGDYLCVARNKVGDDFVVLKVNVVMQPAKIEHKEGNDHRVFYGGDLKVDCVASGLPNPEISWSLPDGSLVNSFMQSDDSGGRAKRYVVFNNGTLYFNEVGLREEGDYTCFAENQVGKDEMTVRVKVVAEPAAIRNKTYAVVRVPYGDVVTVACEAKGEPTPRVTWLSPANRPIPASSEKYQIYQDGTLLIQKAQRSDSGNYTCVVRNSAGEDRKVVWIQVDVQAPRINGNPDAITTVREIAAGGSRKLIDCRAEGVPTPKVLWAFPEGVVLPAPYFGNRVTIHRNGTLDIKSLRKTDSVQLTCIGRNEGGEAKLVVQLTVLEAAEKPVFHDPVSEKITAMAGHTISLNCSAAGTPTPTLVWVLPNGTELPSGQRLQRFYHKGDGKLHVSGLSSVDAGAYRCVARNSAGHTERLVSLKVGLKPDTSQQYRNLVSIVNGETLHLHCLPPSGGRPGRPSWTLPNGMSLQGPQTRGRFSLWDNGTLTVRGASVFDRGTYVCRSDAEHGPSAVSFPVIVIAYPPRITSEPTPVIYTRPGNTVKLNCMAMGIPKAEITWELPDRSQLTAGAQARLYGHRFVHPQGSLTIQQTTQRDSGFYKCTAKNILGSDSKTTYIHVY